MKLSKTLRIISLIMLIVAMLPLPYAYYQVLRLVVCIASGQSAYQAHEKKNTTWVWLLGINAVIYNPITPFYLGREIWILVNVISIILILISFSKLKESKKNLKGSDI